MNRILLSI